MRPLIYDIGMFDGEDSRFYLHRGYRVVAVEADPLTCATTVERLREFVESGQLTVVNRAIAASRGSVTFYRSANPDWGTIVDSWQRDNAALGVPSQAITVEGITLADLVNEFGEAFYMKIDIEGMDRRALESLHASAVRPSYVSMETSLARDPSFEAVKREFEVMAGLGYDRFKIIDQQPLAARAGLKGSDRTGPSGHFGEETPGRWLSQDEALAFFARLIRRKWIQVRLYPRIRAYKLYCGLIHRLTGRFPNLGWYDIHAKHCDVA